MELIRFGDSLTTWGKKGIKHVGLEQIEGYNFHKQRNLGVEQD